MTAEASPSRIETGVVVQGVEFTGEGVFELDDGQRALFIDKAIIRRCAFRRGFVAERGGAAIAVGLGLVAAGVFALYRVLFFSHVASSRWVVRVAAIGLTFLLLGVVLLRHALRRGVYLELDTDRGVRKLTVGKSVETAALHAIVSEIQSSGYVVDPPASTLGVLE